MKCSIPLIPSKEAFDRLVKIASDIKNRTHAIFYTNDFKLTDIYIHIIAIYISECDVLLKRYKMTITTFYKSMYRLSCLVK